jgi:predicted nucleic acid-binding protein
MPRKPKAIVLDSWAIMAYLEDEPSAEQIADIIADAHESNVPLMMTVINLGEVWYIIAREVSEAEAERSIVELQDLGIKLIDADWKLTREAAYFKSKYRMSYADCFAAALAKEKKAHLITGDKEFKQVEQEVSVMWV